MVPEGDDLTIPRRRWRDLGLVVVAAMFSLGALGIFLGAVQRGGARPRTTTVLHRTAWVEDTGVGQALILSAALLFAVVAILGVRSVLSRTAELRLSAAGVTLDIPGAREDLRWDQVLDLVVTTREVSTPAGPGHHVRLTVERRFDDPVVFDLPLGGTSEDEVHGQLTTWLQRHGIRLGAA